MSNDSSAKYYQGNKGRLQKSIVKDIKVFRKKKKKKSGNIGMNDTKIFLWIKSKGWLSIEENITESQKMFQYDQY